jgi:hypothetical protein
MPGTLAKTGNERKTGGMKLRWSKVDCRLSTLGSREGELDKRRMTTLPEAHGD